MEKATQESPLACFQKKGPEGHPTVVDMLYYCCWDPTVENG